MPKKTYYIDHTETDSITVDYKLFWKNTTIYYNKQEIGSIKNAAELKAGKSFQLDDDRTLTIKRSGGIYPEINILVNDYPAVGSPTDPYFQVDQITKFIYVLGAFSLVGGIITELLQLELLLNNGIGYNTIVYGAVIISLGYWFKSKQSKIGLSLIIGILSFDILSTFYFISQDPNLPSPVNGVLIKLFFIFYIAKGYGALNRMKG